jgi:NADPH:quinone reductase-like Zn-dependent oxidoreductase
MKAGIRRGWTGFSLGFSSAYPVPKLPKSPNKMLVKIHCGALNPVDYKLPRALLGEVLGLDWCGTIVQLPPNCNNPELLKVGDIVFGRVHGTLAEYAVVDTAMATKMPAHWTPAEAAALPTACGTALDGFQLAGMLPPDARMPEEAPVSTLLVIGASGGCGLMAVQLAKGMAIPRVVGICSTKNTELCLANGASEVVPYDDPVKLEAFLKDNIGKIDVIYDAASYSGASEDYCDNKKVLALLSGDRLTSSYVALNGALTSFVKAATIGKLLGFTLQKKLVLSPKIDPAHLKLGLDLMDKGNLKPVIDSSYELSEPGVQEAYKKLKSRRATGKIVVEVSMPDNGQ